MPIILWALIGVIFVAVAAALYALQVARTRRDLVLRLDGQAGVASAPITILRGTDEGWVTRLGRWHNAEDVVRMQSPLVEPLYGVGAAGAAADAGEGTDFHAVGNRYISVTPLQIDLTNREQMAGVGAWLGR